MIFRLLLNEETFQPIVAEKIIDFAFNMLAHFVRNGNVPEDGIVALMHQLVILALDSCPLSKACSFTNIVCNFFSLALLSFVSGSIRKGIEAGRWFGLMKRNILSDGSDDLTNREILHSNAGSISPSKVLTVLTAYCLNLRKLEKQLLGTSL